MTTIHTGKLSTQSLKKQEIVPLLFTPSPTKPNSFRVQPQEICPPLLTVLYMKSFHPLLTCHRKYFHLSWLLGRKSLQGWEEPVVQ